MIAKVDGKHVSVFKSDGSLVRRIYCTCGTVSAAYVNGDEVNVQFHDGTAAIYKIDGSLIRHIR